MPSSKPARRLQDIIENAESIQRYIEGMTFERFEEDSRTYDAVERCLERISEAASKLGDLAVVWMPEQPWGEIRGLGNWLRHQYDQIYEDRIWHTVQVDLPVLAVACKRRLESLDPNERDS